jgi:hypothetical protein
MQLEPPAPESAAAYHRPAWSGRGRVAASSATLGWMLRFLRSILRCKRGAGYTMLSANKPLARAFWRPRALDGYTIRRNHCFTIGYPIWLTRSRRGLSIVADKTRTLRREEVIGRTARAM